MPRNKLCEVCGSLALWTFESCYYCNACHPMYAKFVLTHKCFEKCCRIMVETNPQQDTTGLYCVKHDAPQKLSLPKCEIADCPNTAVFRLIGKPPTRCEKHSLIRQVRIGTGCCKVGDCMNETESSTTAICEFHSFIQSEYLKVTKFDKMDIKEYFHKYFDDSDDEKVYTRALRRAKKY